MDLQNLPGAQYEGVASAPLSEAEIKAAFEQELADKAALTIVLQDVRIAEQFVQSKNLTTEWNACDDTFRAYVPINPWPGDTTKQRANLPMPVVMEAVESLLPQAHMAFFSDPQPFLLEPKGTTSPAAARAMAKVLCWAIDAANVEEEIRKMLKSAFVYGQSIGKYGWKRATHKRKTYSQTNGRVKTKTKTVEISQPTFEWVDLRNCLVDSGTRSHDIQEAGSVIHQAYINPSELDKLREEYENVPTRAELAALLTNQAQTAAADSFLGLKYKTWRENQAELQNLPTSSDPLQQPIEILERWTDDRVITVLERCIVLRNEENTEFSTKPFRSCAFIDVLNSFYGFGVAKLLAGEQAFQTGVAGLYVDGLNLSLNPMWHRQKGHGASSQVIKTAPGKVINDDGELKPLEMPDGTSATALTAIQASEARAGRRVGSNFGPEMPTQAMRTAEGVQAFTSGVQVRLQYFIESFADMVYVPVLEAFIELCKDNLTPDQIKGILSDEDGQAYQGDIMDVYNGTYSVDVLSSTKLANRRAMAQMIPMLAQMFGAEPVQQSLSAQGKKLNYLEFIEQIGDITGWPVGDLILPMTDEDKQQAMMNNPAVVQAQAKQQQQAQQHQNDLEAIQAKGDVQGGLVAVKHVFKANEPAKPLGTSPPPKPVR